MYNFIYQIKKENFDSENGNSFSNNSESIVDSYKENYIENKKQNISL